MNRLHGPHIRMWVARTRPCTGGCTKSTQWTCPVSHFTKMEFSIWPDWCAPSLCVSGHRLARLVGRVAGAPTQTCSERGLKVRHTSSGQLIAAVVARFPGGAAYRCNIPRRTGKDSMGIACLCVVDTHLESQLMVLKSRDHAFERSVFNSL